MYEFVLTLSIPLDIVDMYDNILVTSLPSKNSWDHHCQL